MDSVAGVKSAQGRAIPEPKKSAQELISEALFSPPSDDAAKVSLNQNKFIGDVEKHIDDYKKGRGYLSKEIAGELGNRDSETATTLAFSNIRALKLYSGYGATFSYDKRARFVEALSYSVASTNDIAKIYKS